MNRTVSFVLLAVGGVLLFMGFTASDSLGSDISRFFTGTPTDKAVWMLLVGAVCAVVGAGGLIRGTGNL